MIPVLITGASGLGFLRGYDAYLFAGVALRAVEPFRPALYSE